MDQLPPVRNPTGDQTSYLSVHGMTQFNKPHRRGHLEHTFILSRKRMKLPKGEKKHVSEECKQRKHFPEQV